MSIWEHTLHCVAAHGLFESEGSGLEGSTFLCPMVGPIPIRFNLNLPIKTAFMLKFSVKSTPIDRGELREAVHVLGQETSTLNC